MPHKNKAPKAIEMAATTQEGIYVTSDSKAGLINEKKEAENITPAAKPVKILFKRGDISLLRMKKTKRAPRVVQIKIKGIPISG